MPFKKGESGNPAGKPKGATNKVTRELKEMILEALDKAGGVEYLQKRAVDSPNAFLSLVGRVLPLQVQGDPNQPLMPASITFVVQQQKESDNKT